MIWLWLLITYVLAAGGFFRLNLDELAPEHHLSAADVLVCLALGVVWPCHICLWLIADLLRFADWLRRP